MASTIDVEYLLAVDPELTSVAAILGDCPNCDGKMEVNSGNFNHCKKCGTIIFQRSRLRMSELVRFLVAGRNI